MEIKIGKYLRKIPHEGEELSFQYPAFRGTYGQIGTYGQVANEIDNAGLKRPSSAETASLVYDAWKAPKEKYCLEIISILKENWLWEFTGNLYLPKSNEEINNGVILDLDSQNLKFQNGKLKMDKNSLVQRLNENDSLVKFVPFGYKIEEQTPKELEKNQYIIKRYGEEGAQKIAEVASKYKNQPYIHSFNSVNEEKTRISALDDSWFFGVRLTVDGDDLAGGDGGRAFGVCAQRKVNKVWLACRTR